MASQELSKQHQAPVTHTVGREEPDTNDQRFSTQSNSDADLEETKEERESKSAAIPPVSAVDTKEPEWAYGFQLFTILVAVTFACFLMLLDGTIVVAAVPRITDDFNSLDDIGWYGAAYQLGSAVFQPLTGKVYMKFKPKWTWLTFFLIFEVGSLICGVATSSAMLIVGRVIAGLGTSGILNGALLIVAECAPMQRRPSTNLVF
ncbi:hypothetical protein ACLMJK_008205 [Lecanora helva]